ncbi:YqhV family protein [Anaerobacillus sp. MEB173]|uniref:YqhV family protein n=1 Tax=Anaerobacillus sp. MEB173 TaxID=3383345 RepID=UPI003F8EE318
MKGWLSAIETTVLSMVILRMVSGLLELSAASLMLRFNTVEKAVAINALLAIVGPIVLITTMTIGLVGMADKVSVGKLLLIALGVILILLGLRR